MKQNRVSARQLFLIIISITSTSVLQPSFRSYFQWGGNGSWLPLFLALVFSILFFQLLLALGRRFPQESIAVYAPKVLSPILGYPLVLVLISIFFLRAVFSLRNMSEFFVASVLPETPISAVIVVMLALVAGAAVAELEGILRFNEIAAPIIITALLLVFAGSIRPNWRYMLPLFSKGWQGLIPVFESAASDLSIIAYMLFIFHYQVNPQEAQKYGRRHLLTAGSLLLLGYFNAMLSFGSGLGAVFSWPYFALTQNFWIIERGEALFIIVWTIAAFTKTSFCLYISALGLAQVFPRLSVGWVVFALLPATAYVALKPENLPKASKLYSQFNQAALHITIIIIVLTLLVAKIRRMGVNTNEE